MLTPGDVVRVQLGEEAWELVEERGMSEADFRDFSFGNAVRLWSSQNPDFFAGTVVEDEARAERERLGL